MSTEEFQAEVLGSLKRIENLLAEIRLGQTSMDPTIPGPQPQSQFQKGSYYGGDPNYFSQYK